MANNKNKLPFLILPKTIPLNWFISMNKKTNLIHLRIDLESLEMLRDLSLANYRTINNEILLAIHNHLKNIKGKQYEKTND
jgi:hypothetical protein